MQAFIRGTLAAVRWGASNATAVAGILQASANLPDTDARAYAALWNTIYTASMTSGDIEALKEQNRIFVATGAAEGIAPDAIYDPSPYLGVAR